MKRSSVGSRRWYVNRGQGYWGVQHERGGRSTGMKGYSRYGSSGKGLSDIGQQVYHALQTSKLKTGYERVMYDREAMLYMLKGEETFRGMYQLPGSPKYAGGEGTFKAPVAVQQEQAIQAYGAQVKATREQAKATGNQFGAITTGRGKGYPSWVMRMLEGAGTSLGKPPKVTGSGGLPIGLALIALKVLL